MKNKKRFWAMLLASAMTLQSFGVAGAEMIVDPSDEVEAVIEESADDNAEETDFLDSADLTNETESDENATSSDDEMLIDFADADEQDPEQETAEEGIEDDSLIASASIGHEYDFYVAGIQEVYPYTGKPVTPDPIARDKNTDRIMREGTDYRVTYENNIKMGIAEIDVWGEGNYKYWYWAQLFRIGYTDVTDEKAYYYDAVVWATVNNIAGGYKEDNTFRPQEACTRGQMVTFLWRMAGSPKPKSLKNPFTDLDSSAYYYKAVLWAVEKGITKGYSEDNTFRPNEVCKREHAVMFLWRVAGKPKPNTTVNRFTDISEKDYYYTAALWAAGKKIANGYTQADGTSVYKPAETCMREHIVTFLYRYNPYLR